MAGPGADAARLPEREGGRQQRALFERAARYRRQPGAGVGRQKRDGAAPASAKEQARAAATRLLFTDMLGSTLAVLGGDKAQDTGMTLFGETPDGQGAGFFTGKPHIDELGYAFLFRNYRPDKAKWQTADPLGYPDGWNCLAYCGNGVSDAVDYLGMLTVRIYLLSSQMTRWEAIDKEFNGYIGTFPVAFLDYQIALNLNEALHIIEKTDKTIDHLIIAAHGGAEDANGTGYLQVGDSRIIAWDRSTESESEKKTV